MIAILEEPLIRQQARPISIAAYHRLIDLGELDESIELIDGFLFEKMSKSALHTFVTGALFDALLAILDLQQFWLRTEQPLTLDPSEPEPDISVVRGLRAKFASAHPTTAEFVAEVAITSVSIDQMKAKSYARAGIREYWLIRPADCEIDVYRNPQGDSYVDQTTVKSDQLLLSAALPGFAIKLDDLLPKPTK